MISSPRVIHSAFYKMNKSTFVYRGLEQSARSVTGWSGPITSQALANTGRDLFVYGNAARNREFNRQAALSG
jgi:hypothetical protein